MGLFDKKYCDICGEKIGLLGNRKLEDGNLCKNCASKLSPWFSERRSSTVQSIKDQLAYREENEEKVKAFNATRTLGDYYTVYLDEDNRKFLVSSSKNYRNDNPDVLDFSQVTGCDLDIDERKDEIEYKDADGKSQSYNPPRYDYDYDFYIRLRVNHPWFEEMRFRLNPSSVSIAYGSLLPAAGAGAPAGRPAGHPPRPMGGRPLAMGQTRAFDPTTNAEYQKYAAMGAELKEVLMQVRQDAREEAAAANAPKTAVTCPSCGASTLPTANGCCEYCGAALNL